MLLRDGLEREGGLQVDVRTRTEGYYEGLRATRSLGFRLTREDLGLDRGTPHIWGMASFFRSREDPVAYRTCWTVWARKKGGRESLPSRAEGID